MAYTLPKRQGHERQIQIEKQFQTKGHQGEINYTK
jgi:hypothetical protein